jgi:hypothetical protein
VSNTKAPEIGADGRFERVLKARAADSAAANGEPTGTVPSYYVEQAASDLRDEIDAAGSFDAWLADPVNFVWRSAAR